MNIASVGTPAPAPRADLRARVLLCLFVALALAGVAMLQFVFPPLRDGATVVDIEFARSAREFGQRLASDWTLPAGQAPGWCEAAGARTDRPNTGRLSCQLLFDSLLLVPGYTGLLVFFTLGFAVRAGLGGALPHALCMPALAAGLFDLAENGMTVRAADHLLTLVLADAAVLDVHDAAVVKWWLLAIAAGVVGVAALAAALRAAPAGRALLVGGAALMLAAAVAWGAGLSLAVPPRPQIGMALVAAGLLVLVVWRLRQPRRPLGATTAGT
jgi:hypothetical protein